MSFDTRNWQRNIGWNSLSRRNLLSEWGWGYPPAAQSVTMDR
jgi:hypothetical protein